MIRLREWPSSNTATLGAQLFPRCGGGFVLGALPDHQLRKITADLDPGVFPISE